MTETYEKFHRQMIAANFSVEKQEILIKKKILIVGLGGVGSAAALYLSLSGVGTIGLCDHGRVEEANLHRQIIYTKEGVGEYKVNAAENALHQSCKSLIIHKYQLDATSDLQTVKEEYDLVLDCLDNYQARLAVALYAHRNRLPEISSGARDWGGFVAVFPSQLSACAGCLFGIPGRLNSDVSVGIVGPVAGAVGCWQAALALKFLISEKPQEKADYISIQLWNPQVEHFQIDKRSGCPICGDEIRNDPITSGKDLLCCDENTCSDK